MCSARRSMTTYFAHICFFFLFGFVLSIHAQHVVNPHFYRNTLRCNCENNKKCNTNDGSCPGDKCTLDYFGINCQHAKVSLAMSKAPTNVPLELLDGDDTTCAKRWNGSAIFEIDNLIHFFWVYIFAETVITVNPSLTLYDNQNNPINQQFYQLKLTEKSLLIKSRNDVMYKKLELSNLPNDTCSLEISIGRNLAISSIFSNAGKVISRKLVDGSDKNSHTGHLNSVKRKRWTASLLHDARINHIMIVGNVDHSDKWKFDVKLTLAPRGKTNFQGTRKKDIHKTARQANIRVVEQSLVRNVTVMLKKAKGNGVDINEVYIFGEFQCPPDKYGEKCERHCPNGCGPTRCDPDWGCAGGCSGNWMGQWCDQPGVPSTTTVASTTKIDCRFRYGKQCQYPCPDGCGGLGHCESTNGTCVHGCKAGYLPPLCNATCLPGTFDINCTKTCTHCKKNDTTHEYSCDPTSGECLLGCADSFGGDDCERINVEDDLILEKTGFLIAGLVLFLLLLFYRSLSRVEEESFEEELEVEEARVLQKADDEPPKEVVTVPSDDPEPVKTKPKDDVKQSEPKKKVKQLEPKKEVQQIEPKKEVQKLEPKEEVQQLEPKEEVKQLEPKKEVKQLEPEKEVQHLEPKEEVKHLEPTPDEEVKGAVFHSLFNYENTDKSSISLELSESSAQVVIINPVLR